MNNKLICPFCGKPLQPTHRIEDEYFCENYDCPQTSLTWVGTSSLWKAFADTKKKLDDLSDKNGKLEIELDRTRKALDVALCSLQDIAESDGDFITGSSTTLDAHEYAEMMLDKIKTALEQKDKK